MENFSENPNTPIRNRLRAVQVKSQTQLISNQRETLQENTKNIVTDAHIEALRRQSTAGIGHEPPLTEEEKRLIRETNNLL